MTVMILLAHSYNCGALTDEDVNDNSVREQLASFLEINTVYKVSGNGNQLDSLITSIAKQNQDAKVLPVSSYQWACMLRSLRKNEPTLTFNVAVERYNAHPDVIAYRAADSNGSTSEGSLFVDNKKERAIKCWMDHTCTEVYAVVEASQHVISWHEGPFSEFIANLDYVWSAAP